MQDFTESHGNPETGTHEQSAVCVCDPDELFLRDGQVLHGVTRHIRSMHAPLGNCYC